jgi:hypothetical protein
VPSTDPRINLRAHYERFPATVKGAFVLRAADHEPHQVRLESARVAEVAGGPTRSLELQPVVLEVAPNLDLFVPFEFGIMDLSAGWYELVCDLVVDAVPSEARPGDRFPMPWPRATVRRGTVAVGKAVTAAGAKVRIEQVECTSDCVKIAYLAEEPVVMTVSADGTTLTSIRSEFEEAAGRGKVTVYPVLKSHRRIQIDVKGASGPLEVKLP